MRLFARSFRIIPLTLGAATFLLGVKLFEVASVLGEFDAAAPAIAVAHAEGNAPPAALPPSAAVTEKAPASPAAAFVPTHSQPAESSARPTPAPETPAPPLPSAQEIEVLQQLARRREALDARAQDIDGRADLLRAGEARLDQKLKEMKDLQVLLQSLIKGHDEQQEAQMRSLVKIYENMKPKDAARIFEELEMTTLLPVAERMNERKLAPVMANMNSGKAKAITQELAKLRQLVSGARSAGAG